MYFIRLLTLNSFRYKTIIRDKTKVTVLTASQDISTEVPIFN